MMTIDRIFRLFQVALCFTYSLWNVVFWMYFHIRFFYGLLLLFDPATHVLTTLFHQFLVYLLLTFVAVAGFSKEGRPSRGRLAVV